MEILENKIHLFHYNRIWNSDKYKSDFLDFLKSSKNTKVLLDNTDDCYLFLDRDFDFWKTVERISIQNNINISILNFDKQEKKYGFKKFNFISFPLSHLYGTFDTLIKARQNYNSELKLYDKFVPTYFLKCLNRQPHKSRCLMIDYLAKYNLINEKSLITWNYPSNGGYYKGSEKYRFKFWEEKIIKIDDPDNWHTQYTSDVIDTNNSFIHIVGETPTSNIGFTEKTWKPILNGEIFVLYGVRHQHQQLLSYGFELFDEIFDYTFDAYNYERAVPEIVKQIEKLINSDYDSVYQSVKNKIRHNHSIAIDIIKNKKFIPNIIKNKDDLEIHSMSYNLIPILQDEN
jgi:hypothetical protein